MEAEVGRHPVLQHRPRAAAVTSADGRPETGHRDIPAAAPVARDRSERGEASGPSIRRDPGGVHAGPADDGHAPVAIGAGADRGERVVEDVTPGRQRARGEGRRQAVGIGGRVGSGEAIDRLRGNRVVRAKAGGRSGRPDERDQPVRPGLEPHLLVGDRAATNRGEEPAVGG